MLSILIADMQWQSLYGAKAAISKVHPQAVLDIVTNVEALLEKIEAVDYDLLIFDPKMTQYSGLETIANLLTAKPTLNILVSTDMPEILFAKTYFKAGVLGYIEKDNTKNEFAYAISEVVQGKRYIGTKLIKRLSYNFIFKELISNPFDRLTARENQIAMLLLQSTNQNVIGEILKLCPSTVSSHKINIFKKLGVSNIIDMAALAKSLDINYEFSKRQYKTSKKPKAILVAA